MKSLLSRTIVAGVAIAASAGWVGVQATPASSSVAAAELTPAVAGQPGVRDRSAWQPSPIPSTQSAQSTGSQPASNAQASVPVSAAPAQASQAVQPGVRDRSAWQPSPVPSKSQSQPAAPAIDPAVQTALQPPHSAVAVPAPVAGTAGSAPAALSPWARFSAWLKSIFPFVVVPGSGTGAVGDIDGLSDIAVPDSVISMDQLFNADVLEREAAGLVAVQSGEWKTVTFASRALGREETYLAWLPPGYQTSGRSYPTLYLLHGVGSPEAYGVEEWLGYALTEDLDRMLTLGLIEPMIVILPNGEQSYWINHADGGPRWADYVAVDLVRHVDATFRTDARRERRAIGGLSMGGHGAVQIAYNHPDVFSIAGAHSPTIRPFETSPEFFGDPKWFAQYDPVSLAKSGQGATKVLTWIDVGSEDSWREGSQALYAALAAKRAPVEYRVLEGEHEGWYWQYYLPEYLHFYSSALNANGQTPSGAPQVVSHLLTSSVSVLASPSIAHS